MWWKQNERPFVVLSSVAAAIVFTSWKHYFQTQAYEISSEIICWLLLPILIRGTFRSETTEHTTTVLDPRQRTSPIALWAVSFCIAVTSVYRSEYGVVQTYPLLIPLLLLASRLLKRQSSIKDTVLSYVSSVSTFPTIGIAILATVALYNEDSRGAVWPIVALLAQLLPLITFLPRPNHGTIDDICLHIHNVEEAITSLSWRVVFWCAILLVAQTSAYGFPNSGLVATLTLGICKVLSWFFIIRTAQTESWCIAPAIETFAILGTRNPAIQTNEAQAILHFTASIFELGQTICMLSKQRQCRHYLWLFALIFIVPYLTNMMTINAFKYSAQRSLRNGQGHPVADLAEDAKSRFESLILRQSYNYTAAHIEYWRRYDIEPPAGFREWYDYALLQDLPILDDYDDIYHAVAPLRRLSGQQIATITEKAYTMPDSDLWLCAFTSNDSTTRCTHPWRTNDRHFELMFNELLGPLNTTLPNIKFLVNHLDEPRIVSPTETSSRNNESFIPQINMTKLSHQPLWDALTQNCSAHKIDNDRTTPSAASLFMPDQTSNLDICQYPEYAYTHGLFQSSKLLPLFQGLVPILSTGALSTMSDILIPSPAYISKEFGYNELHDIDWAAKRNNLYWRGSTTGSFTTEDNQWKDFHRQRFVTLAQQLDKKKKHTYLREGDDGRTVELYNSTFLNSRLFDGAFTKVVGCAPRQCHAEASFFHLLPPTNRHQALHSRLVFDIDGNGISGRYYQLLASKSAVLKQTLFREWHDDRLVPWYHYIPVSLGMEELPELVNYLVYSEEGQKIAQEIAEQGREWYKRSLREVDMRIYVWRLMLELARLQDPAREGGSQ